MPTKRTTRTTRHEVTEHTVKPAETIVEPTHEVVEKRVETTETFPAPAPEVVRPAPKNVNLNVNATSDPATGDQVSVNTPDGTQVNINR
jgi:hypothetical protein